MTRLTRRRAAGLMLLSGTLAWAAPAHAGIRDDAPPRLDPFTGVLNRQDLTAGDPQALRSPKQLRAALLLSENTRQHVAWCEKQTAGLGSIDRGFMTLFGGSQAAADSDRIHMLAYDPRFVSDNVARPLVQRFASIALVDSVEAFRQGGHDVLILVDVSFVNTFSDGFIVFTKYEVGTYINLYFIDGSGALLGKVETGDTQAVPRNRFLMEVASHRQATLGRYEASLTSLLGPVPGSAPAGAALPPSAAERLKALDALVKQGLLTPEEAAAKRAEILKSL